MDKKELYDYLDLLYQENEKAIQEGEVPVSALLVLNDNSYLLSHNTVEKDRNPLHHAEINVLTKGFMKADIKYLKDATLIVSLEPCLACMGAILKSGISSLYYVLDDEKDGALSYHHVFVDNRIAIHRIDDPRFKTQLQSFFENLRGDSISC